MSVFFVILRMAYFSQYYYNRHQQQARIVEVVRRTRPNLILQSYNTESCRIQIPADDELELMVPETLLNLNRSGINDPVILLTWRPKDIYSAEMFKPVYEIVAKPRMLRIQTPTDNQAKTFQLDYQTAENGFKQISDQHTTNRGLVLKFSNKQWVFEAIDLDPIIKHRILSCSISSDGPPLRRREFSQRQLVEEEEEEESKQRRTKMRTFISKIFIQQIILPLFISILFTLFFNAIYGTTS